MIAHLEGRLQHKAPEHLIVSVQGVGYRVQVPLSTFYQLPEPGGAVSLHIHTHVREDSLQLYGFRSLAEKETFLHLIGISGVGPRLAISILSGIQAEELRQVVILQDRARLQRIPGVGKKTAERILLELRDKFKAAGEESQAPVAPLPTDQDGDGFADAFSALTNLGYRPAEAMKAVRRAKASLDLDQPDLETLLKEALRILAR